MATTGSSGDDILNGTAGNDTLNGGAVTNPQRRRGQRSSLVGGSGDDILNGGSGSDILNGDSGNDTLIYNLAENAGAKDDLYRRLGHRYAS